MTLTDPAIVLVMALAGYSILRGLIPLATSWNVLFVTEHSLENQLVVVGRLNRITAIYLVEICLALNLHLDTIDDVVGDSMIGQGVLDNSLDAHISLNILILSTPDTLMQVNEVF